MDGYEVIANDGHSVGRVVGEQGDSIVVEHGLLRKHRRALPRTYVTVDDENRTVRTTLSKELIEHSPELDDDVDEQEIAAYYGLADGYEQPETLGYGEIEPDETAVSADVQTRQVGLETPEEERARIREGREDVYGAPGRQIIPPDPHEDVPGRSVKGP
jgi:hypothetical protein